LAIRQISGGKAASSWLSRGSMAVIDALQCAPQSAPMPIAWKRLDEPGVAVGVGAEPRQPSSATLTLLTTSSTETSPSRSRSPALHRSTPTRSNAMLTRVTSSWIATAPLPSQSPAHAAAGTARPAMDTIAIVTNALVKA
jgi:hypothetical protein